MKIDFTEIEIEQIKSMFDYAKRKHYFPWCSKDASRLALDKEIHEIILRKLDIGE